MVPLIITILNRNIAIFSDQNVESATKKAKIYPVEGLISLYSNPFSLYNIKSRITRIEIRKYIIFETKIIFSGTVKVFLSLKSPKNTYRQAKIDISDPNKVVIPRQRATS